MKDRAGLLAAGLSLRLLVLAAAPAFAHDQTTSYSTWQIRGSTVEVAVRMTLLDVSRLPWANAEAAQVDRRLGAYLADRLTMRAGNERCRMDGAPHAIPGARDRVGFGWRLECPSPGDLRLRSDVLLDVAPSHLHFARVEIEGQPPLERVLSEAEREWSIGRTGGVKKQPAGDSVASYLRLGIGSIARGYDHLAFIAALLLAAGSMSAVARALTGFAVAHSVTLALAVLGLVQLDLAPVASLIGFSIALVAAENLWQAAGRATWIPCAIAAALAGVAAAAALGHGRLPALTLAGLALFAASYFGLLARADASAPLRSGFAFVFGLVHGLGFAGALLDTAVPADRVAASLFGFNLGIELGQLALVAASLVALRLVRGMSFRDAAVDYASAAALMIGTYWFVARAFA